MPTESLLSEASQSLERVQKYDTQLFDDRERLGSSLNMDLAIPPADRLVKIFNLLPLTVLDEFADQQLTVIKTQADQVYNLLEQAAKFTADQDNPTAARTTIVKNIENQYDKVFVQVFPFVSYASARATDFQRLEIEGRAAVQSISDKTSSLQDDLESAQEEAQKILQDVRKTAAEQGVSQQAIYFKDEADNHEDEANLWKAKVYWWGGALILYAFVSFFIHKVLFLTPTNAFEASQIIASKVLFFVVLAYMLFLSARNFLSHRHNAVTNRHRQNSLVTFKALVDAGSTSEARDVVLRHAAASVFMPLETGYIRPGLNSANGATTLIELGAKTGDPA